MALLLCGTLAPSTAEAARIRPAAFRAQSSRIGARQAWAQFLSGGPELWATTPSPRIPSGARLPLVNGGLLQTPFVDYLLWRRALNPTRFDANHPNVARVFSQLVGLPTVQTTSEVVAPVVTPPEITPLNPAAQVITPEPGTMAMTVTFLLTMVLWRFRGRVGS